MVKFHLIVNKEFLSLKTFIYYISQYNVFSEKNKYVFRVAFPSKVTCPKTTGRLGLKAWMYSLRIYHRLIDRKYDSTTWRQIQIFIKKNNEKNRTPPPKKKTPHAYVYSILLVKTNTVKQ
jgi:hypothetical protein